MFQRDTGRQLPSPVVQGTVVRSRLGRGEEEDGVRAWGYARV